MLHAGVRGTGRSTILLLDESCRWDEAARDVDAPVSGAIVDEYELDVVVLTEDALDRLREIPLAVPERHDRRDGGASPTGAHVCTACSSICLIDSGTAARSDPKVSS